MSAVHALVLAAGFGRRFGGGKLTAPYHGGLLIDGALSAALSAPVAGVTVVTGAEREAVEAAVGDRPVRLVHAADHAEGMAASLRAGVAALPPTATGVLVFLGDMPAIPAAIPPRLVQALDAGAPAAVPTFEGAWGHPAAFSAALFPKLLALRGDRGARAVLEALGEALATVAAPDHGVLVDIDRPEDLSAP